MRVGQEVVCVDASCREYGKHPMLKLHKTYKVLGINKCVKCGGESIIINHEPSKWSTTRCYTCRVESIASFRSTRFVPLDELPMPPKEITEPEPMQLIEALAQKMDCK